MSAMDFEEAGHKLLKIELGDGQEAEVVLMVIECCSQEKTYLKCDLSLLGPSAWSVCVQHVTSRLLLTAWVCLLAFTAAARCWVCHAAAACSSGTAQGGGFDSHAGDSLPCRASAAGQSTLSDGSPLLQCSLAQALAGPAP